MEVVEGIEIISELPVLYIRKYKALVLADTHIGFEEEMADRGIFIPRFQLRKLLDILSLSLATTNVDEVIIAGDFKHRFSGLGKIERKELSIVLEYLLSKVDRVIVVRGNHDNYLPLLQKKFNFIITNEYILGDEYLIIHGHKLPQTKGNWRYLIMGHEHPSISLRDSLGTIGKFSCFLVGPLSNGKTLITLPAVGAYQTGSKVTLDKDTYLSPVIRELAIIERLRPIIIDEEAGLLELPALSDLWDMI